MNNTIKRAWNSNKLVTIEDLSGMTFQGEYAGHTFEVSGIDDSGSAVQLSGTVTAVFLRADNAAISISGSISSGKAVVTLTSDCYTVPGRFLFTIFTTANSQKTAIYSATGNVARTDGVATGSVPPLVADSVQTGSLTVSGNASLASLDVTSQRSIATLSSEGWYRAMKTANVGGTIIDFYIGRPYGANPAETHKISFFVAGGGKSTFAEETSATNTLCIDKIRCTYDSGYMYFDVHYYASTSNEVLVYFNVYGKGKANSSSVAMGLTSVAASPSGETVLTTYEFAANIQPTYLKRYVDSTAANYTIGSDGYVMVSYPTGLTGNKVVSIGIEAWMSNSGPFLICPYGSTNTYWYIIGSSGTTINGVKFCYWYID